MKKVLILLLLIVAIIAFAGCENDSLESQLERAKEQSNAAQEAYEQSKRNYDNILDDFDDYQKSQDYLDSFK